MNKKTNISEKVPQNFSAEIENSGKNKVDNYIKEMKELPPEMDEKQKNNVPQGVPEVAIKGIQKLKITNDQNSKTSEAPVGPDVDESMDFQEGGENSDKLPISSKDIILGLINVVTIVFLVILLSKFPQKSEELKSLRNESLMVGSIGSFEISEIEDKKIKADKLNDLFLDEGGVVDFVNEVEKIKSQGGSIAKVTFTSGKAVKDRTENFGVPIVIEMKGGWDSIGKDLEEIEKLPFLFRSAVIEAKINEEDAAVIDFKYGVFLYVIDRLGQTR
jgi:hypothetical protein